MIADTGTVDAGVGEGGNVRTFLNGRQDRIGKVVNDPFSVGGFRGAALFQHREHRSSLRLDHGKTLKNVFAVGTDIVCSGLCHVRLIFSNDSGE